MIKRTSNRLYDVLTYSIKEDSDIKQKHKMMETETQFKVNIWRKELSINIPVYGEPFIYNSLKSDRSSPNIRNYS